MENYQVNTVTMVTPYLRKCITYFATAPDVGAIVWSAARQQKNCTALEITRLVFKDVQWLLCFPL